MNITAGKVGHLRDLKINLVNSEVLSKDLLRVIFSYAETFIDVSKIKDINALLDSALDIEGLSGIDYFKDNTVILDSFDSSIECARLDVDELSDLENRAGSPARKRRLEVSATELSAVKKLRCDDKPEHKHDESCWRENSPTLRPSSSKV